MCFGKYSHLFLRASLLLLHRVHFRGKIERLAAFFTTPLYLLITPSLLPSLSLSLSEEEGKKVMSECRLVHSWVHSL